MDAINGQILLVSFACLAALFAMALLIRMIGLYLWSMRRRPYVPAQGIHGPIQCARRDSTCHGKVTTRVTDRKTVGGVPIVSIRCDKHAREP